MNKKYKILYLPLFYKDLQQIYNYIVYVLKNKIVAENIINQIKEEIEKRSYNPTSYHKYISLRKRKDTYYRIYVKNYVIFYIVIKDTMEIRRILYNKRNFEKII